MAWTAPYTFTVNEVLTADTLNSMLRDNMNEQAPAKAVNRGGYFVSTGANALAERQLLTATANTGINISSTTFVNSVTGPRVSVTHGGMILVIFAARIYQLTSIGVGSSSCSVAVEGKVPASFEWALRHAGDSTDLIRCMSYHLFTGLTPGTDTVRMEYSVSAGTGTFHQRQLMVMPF